MLTLFIIKTNEENANTERLIHSLVSDDVINLVSDIRFCDEIKRENISSIKTEWYMYLYDNEHLDERLLSALKLFLVCKYLDFLVLFKIHPGHTVMSYSSRIFRRNIILNSDMTPENGELLIGEKCLNGWIFEG